MTDSSDAAIAKAVIALGLGLHLNVLAEGVETIEQLELLRSMGCQMAQGYLFSKPLPPSLMTQLLQESRTKALFKQSALPEANQFFLKIPEIVRSELSVTKVVEQQLEEVERKLQALERTIREQEQLIAKQQQLQEGLKLQLRQEQTLVEITEHLCQLQQVEELLNFTVTQTHHLLHIDRLVVYRFGPDWSGNIAAEAVTDPWSSLLNSAVEDSCFREQYAQYYQAGNTRAIDDIHQAVLAPCHVKMLTQYEVRANLVAPILQGETLWGLLIAHQCKQPRHWQSAEIMLLKRIATQLGAAIQRAELYHRLAQMQCQQD